MQTNQQNIYDFEEIKKHYPEREIENIFKVVDPIFWEDDNLPPKGILLRDKITDELQCHVCGIWNKGLAWHIKKHELNTEDYKKTYGLPLYQPLCSVSTSLKRSQESSKPNRLEHLAKVRNIKMVNKTNKKRKKNRINRIKLSLNSLGHQNKIGLCNEQIKDRFFIVSDQTALDGKKRPSWRDIQKYDSPLHGAIKRRFGNYNTFLESLDIMTIQKPEKQTRQKLISFLRGFSKKYNRLPRSNDFRNGTPNITTIRNHFGSFNRALVTSGLE